MLSFALSKYDSAIIQLVREVKTGLEQTDPILGQIQRMPVAHDGTTRQVSEPKIVDTEMQDFSAVVTVELEWFRKTDVESFVEFLWRFCDEFSSQTKKYLFEMVSKTTEAVGNVFDAKDKNIWEAQIEMMQQMEMRFDEDGNHNYRLYVSPDTAKKLEENPPTPEQQKRMEELINAKREEYYAQKRTRRLS